MKAAFAAAPRGLLSTQRVGSLPDQETRLCSPPNGLHTYISYMPPWFFLATSTSGAAQYGGIALSAEAVSHKKGDPEKRGHRSGNHGSYGTEALGIKRQGAQAVVGKAAMMHSHYGQVNQPTKVWS